MRKIEPTVSYKLFLIAITSVDRKTEVFWIEKREKLIEKFLSLSQEKEDRKVQVCSNYEATGKDLKLRNQLVTSKDFWYWYKFLCSMNSRSSCAATNYTYVFDGSLLGYIQHRSPCCTILLEHFSRRLIGNLNGLCLLLLKRIRL